jgi:hypothetical protein
MASSDPLIQQALADPTNIGFVKSVLGLSDLVVPGEDSRNKQLREIDLLLGGAPISRQEPGGKEARGNEAGGREAGDHLVPSVPVDLLLDDHVVELEECRRWANSDAGQVAHVENPVGFANVRAHAAAHLGALGLAYVKSNSIPSSEAASEQTKIAKP